MTTEEIHQSLVNEKDSYSELAELDSSSKVAIWRLMLYIFAFHSKAILELFNDFKAEIKRIFAIEQIGTIEWWIDRVKKFQYDDELEFTSNVWKYANIDEDKQIIKRVALETRQFVLFFKTAKIDTNGNLIPLETSEKAALQAYINKISMPGTYTGIISENADDIKVWLRIYYNAEITENELQLSINEAINTYLADVVFNGKFIITKMADELQKINGIENPVVLNVKAKPASNSNADYADVTDFYIPVAGYSALNELNIEFIQNV